MVWAAGAEKPTVYDTAKGDGSCTELDAAFTPVLWQSVGRTRLQLELLGSDGSVIWQSPEVYGGGGGRRAGRGAARRNRYVGRDDAAEDVASGKVFYGADGRQVGTNLLAAVAPSQKRTQQQSSIHCNFKLGQHICVLHASGRSRHKKVSAVSIYARNCG